MLTRTISNDGLPQWLPSSVRERWVPAARLPASTYVLRTALAMVAVLALGLCVQLLVISRLQYWAAQTRGFDQLRKQLAEGVSPVNQVDGRGRLLKSGTAVAYLTFPKLGTKQVVFEGTSSEVLMSGPGHLRDTVLPGQAGTSIIFGRAAAYGAPFGAIHTLHKGDKIVVTSGGGTSTFSVIDVRHAGDPVPPPITAGSARLTLVTATGLPFIPSGVVRVDADLVGNAQPDGVVATTSVPSSEIAMGSDTGNLWVLVL